WALVAIFALVPPVAAEEPATDRSGQAAELVDHFSAICLHAYPDMAAVAARVDERHGIKLTNDQFLGMLGGLGKSGSGWVVGDDKKQLFGILLSEGSDEGSINGNKACIVVTAGPSDMPVREAFDAVKKDYALQKRKELSPLKTIPLTAGNLWESQFIGLGTG